MEAGILMAESFDNEQDMAVSPAKHLEEFKRKVDRLELEGEESAIISYFYGLVEASSVIEKDQREIGEAVGMPQHRVSLAISSLVKKGVIKKGKNGKYNYYMFNLEFEVPAKRAGLVVPFRKKIERRGV